MKINSRWWIIYKKNKFASTFLGVKKIGVIFVHVIRAWKISELRLQVQYFFVNLSKYFGVFETNEYQFQVTNHMPPTCSPFAPPPQPPYITKPKNQNFWTDPSNPIFFLNVYIFDGLFWRNKRISISGYESYVRKLMDEYKFQLPTNM